MWLSLLWFVMHTWVMHNHFEELSPNESGPLLFCNICCYAILFVQCCWPPALAWVPAFVLWATVLLVCLLILFETWSLVAAAWVFSAICTQIALHEVVARA